MKAKFVNESSKDFLKPVNPIDLRNKLSNFSKDQILTLLVRAINKEKINNIKILMQLNIIGYDEALIIALKMHKMNAVNFLLKNGANTQILNDFDIFLSTKDKINLIDVLKNHDLPNILKPYSTYKNIDNVKDWLNFINIKAYSIDNKDNIINVHQNVDIHNLDIVALPNFIQFGNIDGYFAITYCNLITLKGCPSVVENNFSCTHNNLRNLNYCPIIVNGSFICHHNETIFDKNYILSKCKTPKNRIQN